MRLQVDEHLLSVQSAVANAFGHGRAARPPPGTCPAVTGRGCRGNPSGWWLLWSHHPLSPAHQRSSDGDAAVGCRWCHLAYSPGALLFPYAISLQKHGKYFIPYSKGCLIFYYFKAAHECFTETISSGRGWNRKVQGKFPAKEFWGLYLSHPVPMVAANLVC